MFPARPRPPAQDMGAGNFFGAIHGAGEQCGALFTDVRHTSPRKLPRHSHELAFFALLLRGHYRERWARSEGRRCHRLALDVPKLKLPWQLGPP